MNPWVMHKFGGSSLADASRFERVANILLARDEPRQAVVVSALGGVTDDLLGLLEAAGNSSETWRQDLATIRARHDSMAGALLDSGGHADYMEAFDADCRDINDVLRATMLLRKATDSAQDVVAGYGELWSARLLCAYLALKGGGRPACGWLDARDVLVVEDSQLGPAVDWERSGMNMKGELDADFNGTLVITGFIARGPDGAQTTLGRNGSDYSASIFAALLEAAEIHIWTDVSGIMSADPRRVPEVKTIDQLSYHEAMELAYFGARVIHPQTMAPAVARNIPIYIRSTFEPERPGTRIGHVDGTGNDIKGITTIDGIALVNLEGAGMIGVPGTAQRLFAVLGEAGISVVMISQGSSEHSICFAVAEALAAETEAVVRKGFARELEDGHIQDVQVTHGCSILAVVGDKMAGTPGVAAKVFSSLGNAGINVRVIAQGSSERNISAVIDSIDAERALRAVHAGFYLSPQTLSIGVIGCGNVGGTLLDQMRAEIGRLHEKFKLDLRVRGIASSTRMLLAEKAIDLDNWRALLDADGQPLDLDRFVAHVHAEHLPHAVVVDATADGEVAQLHAAWLARGMHVVTPNKKGNAGSWDYYQQLHGARRASETRYLYETTVGAGLPVIHTLRDLRETGDHITCIEGILSGTLAYLFNLFDGEEKFSKIVRDARDKGYTEPDPREDLSGADVARKVVILGREMGLELNLDDVEVESLVPPDLETGTVEEFLTGLEDYDDAMLERLRQAERSDRILRYVARLTAAGKATVALEALPSEHAFSRLNLTDNIVQFETRYYHENPLIVRGPGAGPAVTAGGVFADLLRLAAYLGTTL